MISKTAGILPSTDVKHLVLVSKNVAQNLAQQNIGASGQNLGSQFTVADCILQAVQGHIYWVCPLQYQGALFSQYNNAFALDRKPLPGFIAVDAENPDAAVMAKLNYHIWYSPNASFEHNLQRHVYEAGYTRGNLTDPTLEVDDNWQPYYTISYSVPTVGFDGDIVSQVLLINAQTGEIKSYTPAETPAWVDRVVPAAFAKTWAENWGQYRNHLAWWNPNHYNQLKPASDPEMVYNSADHPVWLIPMTSNNDSDTSSLGFLEISTRYGANGLPDSHFYPLAGYSVGDQIATAFAHNPLNIRNYSVSTPTLYQIDGNPTWVATFTSSTGNGDLFQAVGLLDARHVNGANVVMKTSLDDALAAYPAQLVQEGIQADPTAQGTLTKTYTAVITRVNANVAGGTTTYYFTLKGYAQIFTATVNLSPDVVLAQPGDSITFAYTATGQKVVPLRAFSDHTPSRHSVGE